MKSDSDLLHEYLDKRSTPNVLKQLHKELLDRKKEAGTNSMLDGVSSIHVEKEGYLQKLGVSDYRDLITDNFGEYLAGFFGNGVTFVITSNAGTPTNVTIRGKNLCSTGVGDRGWNSNYSNNQGIQGWYMSLGDDATLVQRSDFDVGNPAPGLPALVPMVNGGYGSGTVQNGVSIGPASAASIIAEGAVFAYGRSTVGNPMYSCFERYNYSPLAVSIGETVQVSNSLSI